MQPTFANGGGGKGVGCGLASFHIHKNINKLKVR
jgi:hypothetical protein